MCSEKRGLYFITKNLRKGPEHPVLPGHCFEFNLPLLQVKKGCGFWGCEAGAGFLEVRSRKGEQEGISKGFLLSVERQMRINEAWLPFVARDGGGCHQPGAKLGLLQVGHVLWLATCFWICKVGCWSALTPLPGYQNSLWLQGVCPEAFSTLFFFLSFFFF